MRLQLVLLVAALLAPAGLFTDAAAAAPVAPAAAEPFFFGVSPLRVTALHGQAAAQYTIAVRNAPAGDAPWIHWYLTLAPGASRADCANGALAGGTRAGPRAYVWKNQGPSFVWHAATAAGGSTACRGTVTALVENDSEHCTASLAGRSTGTAQAHGQPPRCELGGYLPLAVPQPLLRAYAYADAALAALLREERAGEVRGAALGRRLDAIVGSESAAFERLAPPLWGCRFEQLFGAVLSASGALDGQLAALDAGRRLPRAAVAGNRRLLQRVADVLRSCRPTRSRPVGAPPAAIGAVRQLAAGAAAAPRSAEGLRALADGLDGVLRRDFPAVFGITYAQLVDRVLAARSAVALAERSSSRGEAGAAASALERAAGSARTIDRALRKQSALSSRAAKAA